jgi:hypothetical protein
MAKHDTDPVLAHLVEAVNESRQAGVPLTVSAGGMLLTGVLIAQESYFAELAESSPLMSALQPATGLLGKEYAREVAAEARHHLHLRGGRAGDEELALWRISIEAVDAWSLRAPASAPGDDDKGPFARLLGA